MAVSRESGSFTIGIPFVCEPCLGNNKGESSCDHLAMQFLANMDKVVAYKNENIQEVS